MTTLRIDRAEPLERGRRRTDAAYLARTEQVITAWPRKLALAPDLADRLLDTLPAPAPDAAQRDAALLEALADAARPAPAPSFATAAA